MTVSQWSSVENPRRFYLVPDGEELPGGSFCISNLSGQIRSVEQTRLEPFEVTEEQARQWARDQLGQALGKVRSAVDEKFAEWRKNLDEFHQTPPGKDSSVTPDATLGLLDLLKQLPVVVGKGYYAAGASQAAGPCGGRTATSDPSSWSR